MQYFLHQKSLFFYCLLLMIRLHWIIIFFILCAMQWFLGATLGTMWAWQIWCNNLSHSVFHKKYMHRQKEIKENTMNRLGFLLVECNDGGKVLVDTLSFCILYLLKLTKFVFWAILDKDSFKRRIPIKWIIVFKMITKMRFSGIWNISYNFTCRLCMSFSFI